MSFAELYVGGVVALFSYVVGFIHGCAGMRRLSSPASSPEQEQPE